MQPVPDLAPEQQDLEVLWGVVQLCKETTLPPFMDHETEIIANKFSTLTFPPRPLVGFYCKDEPQHPNAYPECSVLQGGSDNRI